MNVWSDSCRICLQDNATIPIFNKDENKNVSAKLHLCLQEKVEEIEGYPKCICEKCNDTITTIFNFINKYKESCKVLENHYLIKGELDGQSDCDRYSEPDIEFNDLKIEFDEVPQFVDEVKDDAIVKRPKKSVVKKKYKHSQTSALKEEQLPKRVVGRQPKLNLNKVKKEIERKGPQKHTPKLCDLCGETFKTTDKLRHHNIRKHMPKMKIPCPMKNCKSILANNACLSRHLKRVHEPNKKYQCSVCGKAFTYKTGLQVHVKIHDRDKYPKKLYKCKFCDKAYKCQKSTDIHERSVHTGLRPAICSVCNAAFYHDEYLKQHMMLHTGETPFHCPVCNRGYNQRGNMKSHLRIHRLSEVTDEIMKKMKPSLIKFLKLN